MQAGLSGCPYSAVCQKVCAQMMLGWLSKGDLLWVQGRYASRGVCLWVQGGYAPGCRGGMLLGAGGFMLRHDRADHNTTLNAPGHRALLDGPGTARWAVPEKTGGLFSDDSTDSPKGVN